MVGKPKWVILCMFLIAGLVMGTLGFSITDSSTIALAADPTTTVKVDTSIDPTLMYEGDWEGTFTYAEPKLDAEGHQVYAEGEKVYANPKDFKVSLTLERFARNYVPAMPTGVDRIVTLKITKVWMSDSNFGTGPNGVTPTHGQIWLPTDPPTNASNPSQRGMGFQINFPNGSTLTTISTLSGGTINQIGRLDVTADGKTLSGNGIFPPKEYQYFTWDASVPLASQRETWWIMADWRHPSWILTKVSKTESTEGLRLTGIVGDVLVRASETGEWTKYDQKTILKIGTWVRTGKSSFVYITYADNYRIGLGPATIVKIEAENYFLVLKGKVKAFVKKLQRKLQVKTPTVVVAVRGTEFTMSAEEDGTTTVMVLDGSVEVQDLASKSVITLQPLEMVTLPKTTEGLTQQDMLAKVKVVQSESIDRLWEQEGDPAVIEKQPSQGSRTIVFMVLAAAAIILLVVGGVLFLRLRRRHGKSQG